MHPGSGKAKPLGPEQRRGRRDLTDIYNYAILRESEETQQLMLHKGQDPLADGWIGHPLVSFGVGKLHVPNPIGEDNMHGATFKRPADVNADMPQPSCRLLATGQGELAKLALQGDTSPGEMGCKACITTRILDFCNAARYTVDIGWCKH